MRTLPEWALNSNRPPRASTPSNVISPLIVLAEQALDLELGQFDVAAHAAGFERREPSVPMAMTVPLTVDE